MINRNGGLFLPEVGLIARPILRDPFAVAVATAAVVPVVMKLCRIRIEANGIVVYLIFEIPTLD